MKKLELVDNEAGSDPGNLRFYLKEVDQVITRAVCNSKGH